MVLPWNLSTKYASQIKICCQRSTGMSAPLDKLSPETCISQSRQLKKKKKVGGGGGGGERKRKKAERPNSNRPKPDHLGLHSPYLHCQKQPTCTPSHAGIATIPALQPHSVPISSDFKSSQPDKGTGLVIEGDLSRYKVWEGSSVRETKPFLIWRWTVVPVWKSRLKQLSFVVLP